MKQKIIDPERPVPDPVLTRRLTAGRLLRLMYASAVIGLGLFLGWQIIKPFLYTQSTGVVYAPAHVVSTPFTARIIELSVTPGASVKKGDVIATVRSPEIDSLRASLLRSVAEQVNKEADLTIRKIVATNTLDAARRRLESAQESVTVIKKYPQDVTTTFKSFVLQEEALAAFALAQIEADISETTNQIEAVRNARKDIEEIKFLVEMAFNEGKQLAPIDGVISAHPAKPGQSVIAGTPIVEIYDPREVYVQWILSADRRIQPIVGAPVYVLDGNRVMHAVISEVLGISERTLNTPTIFSRSKSGQLVRIQLNEGEAYPAIMTDVEVRYTYWRVMDPLIRLHVHLMKWLGLWRAQ
jgi:biotin carboxyl carrier protein